MHIYRITTVSIKVLKILLQNKSFKKESHLLSRSSQSPKLPHEWLHGVPVKAQDTACRSCTKSLINKASTLPEVRSIVTGKGSRDYREKGWAKLKVLSKEETCYRGSWFKAQKSTELTMRSAFLGGIFRTLGGKWLWF